MAHLTFLGPKELILAYLLFPRSEVTKQVLLVSMVLNWFEIFFVWEKLIPLPPATLQYMTTMGAFASRCSRLREGFGTHLRYALNVHILSIITNESRHLFLAYCWTHNSSLFV